MGTIKGRAFLTFAAVAFAIVAFPSGALAYGVDVHFNLTYLLCHMAGATREEAVWIAAADQSMDDNDSTTAFPNEFLGIWLTEYPKWYASHSLYRENGKLFHTFSDAGGTSDTVESSLPRNIEFEKGDDGKSARKEILSNLEALKPAPYPGDNATEKLRFESLIAFGQYLHAKEDYYAHRQWPDCLDNNKYLPYGTKWGHGFDPHGGHAADYVEQRPELAKAMCRDVFADITSYFRRTTEYPSVTLNILVDRLAAAYKILDSVTTRGGDAPSWHLDFPPQDAVCNILSAKPGYFKVPPYDPEKVKIDYDDPDLPFDEIKAMITEYIANNDL